MLNKEQYVNLVLTYHPSLILSTAFKFIADHQFGRGATGDYTSKIQFEEIKLIADDIRCKLPFFRSRSIKFEVTASILLFVNTSSLMITKMGIL